MNTEIMNTEANQPAFPTFKVDEHGDISGNIGGLTKREYFAAMALSIYGNHQSYYSGKPKELAEMAVQCADALLNQLNQSK